MTLHKVDLTSQSFKRNPQPTLAELRIAGPLVRIKLPFIGEAWATTTYEATTSVLRDKTTFVVEPRNAGRRNIAGLQWWMPRAIKAMTNNMLGKDEPDHRRLRQLVESAFVRQSIEELRPRIAVIVDQQLDELKRQADRGQQVDFMEHFARPFPLTVISELLGLPEEDRPIFARWASSFTTVTNATGFLKVIPAIWKINGYLRQQFQKCRRQPRAGMISAMVAAEQEGHRLSEQELLASSFLLLFAGHETTVHLLSMGVLTLLEHPSQKQALLADWSKVGTAVDELLRYNSTIQMTKPRYASRDVALYGQQVKQREVVLPLLAAANCDPAEFSEPETFDITRHPNPHVAFGTGMHVCLGLKLARAEAEIAFERLFTRFPGLQLGVPINDIAWWERIGTRNLKRLPLKLSATVAATGQEVPIHAH